MAHEVASAVSMINNPDVDLIEKAQVYIAYIPSKDDITGGMRPWIGDFCPDMDSFSIPRGPQQAWTRVRSNCGRFQVNYCLLILSVMLWSLITSNPFLLVCAVFFIATTYLAWINAEATIRIYMTYQGVKWGVVGSLLVFASIVLFYLATWLTFMSIGTCLVHALFRDERLTSREGSRRSGEDLESVGEHLNPKSSMDEMQQRRQ